MTIPVPNGPELPPDPATWQWIPAQQGEFLGRILDPVRAKALHEAVRWAGQGADWRQEQPTTQRILEVAETFRTYLDPETE